MNGTKSLSTKKTFNYPEGLNDELIEKIHAASDSLALIFFLDYSNFRRAYLNSSKPLKFTTNKKSHPIFDKIFICFAIYFKKWEFQKFFSQRCS